MTTTKPFWNNIISFSPSQYMDVYSYCAFLAMVKCLLVIITGAAAGDRGVENTLASTLSGIAETHCLVTVSGLHAASV